MFRIKRLYSFVIQTFFPVFMMTLAICLFILLMQFLWKVVEDLVGKGLDNLILIELFFYAMLNLIPLAIPLAILLASLMAFGNMGERLELLATKAAGVSLLKTMRPLIIFIGLVSIGAFFFQNEAMPRIQVKLRSLVVSVKRKSPELDIPEGAFYNSIRNYSIYVDKKNKETGMLYDVMIYDTSNGGFEDMSVFVCDSADMESAESKDYLTLNLYSGQRFANFKHVDLNAARSTKENNFVPYSRENFKTKIIIIRFDSDFNRIEESEFGGSQISKNIDQLSYSIDSMTVTLDSLNAIDRKEINNVILQDYQSKYTDKGQRVLLEKNISKQENIQTIDFDSLLTTFSEDQLLNYIVTASSAAENTKNKYMFDSLQKSTLQSSLRKHRIEWHQKFVLSFACLIFFFIGAPLGAIIRKGGLGMPVVMSVLLFIVYYMIDNIGRKMARDGVWAEWQGMWLSSFVLFPLGVFLTYKAMNDSALFNTEAYAKNIRRLLGVKTKSHVNSSLKIIDITEARSLSDLNADPDLITSLQVLDDSALKNIVRNYKQYDYDEKTREIVLSILKERGSKAIDIVVQNWDRNEAEKCYTTYRKDSQYAWFAYVGILLSLPVMILIQFDWITWLPLVIYNVFFIKSLISYSDFYNNIDKKDNRSKKSKWMTLILSNLFFVFVYKNHRKKMKEDLDNAKW